MSLAEILPVSEKASPTQSDILLAPLPGPNPAGSDVRYAGDYDAIGEARRQDNAALPQGVWLRELKRADWNAVERLCVETLTSCAKDLQVAAWLTEAWVHQRGFAGLERGLVLLLQLCERFWPDLHPAIEDADLSARLAPLEWLNGKLPDLLRSLPILRAAADPEEYFSWTDYVNAQRLETLRQRDAAAAERAAAAGAVTLPRFDHCRQGTDTAWLKEMSTALKQALAALVAFDGVMQHCCGREAPGLGAIRTSLEEISAFAAAELESRRKPPLFASLLRKAPPSPPAPAPAARPPAAVLGALQTRADAYHQLSEIAEFLLRTEPHSPTPYLIQRAADWGDLPLPELVQQLSQSGSDISRLLEALGLLQQTAEFERIEADER